MLKEKATLCFRMDNALWLDPILERTFMKAIKTVTNGPSLRRELINNNLAIDNPQVRNLYKTLPSTILLKLLNNY